MGILNVTPDSFSDGQPDATVEDQVRRGLAMLEEGADILDIGGESTRPGATSITASEEQRRVLAVIAALLRERPEAVLSIDTYHASTARAAIVAGAEIVNDVSGLLWGAEMAKTCAQLECGLVLTHTRGRPEDWAGQPPLSPLAVITLVLTGLRDSIFTARTSGISSDHLILDPGLGFGKRGDENFVIHAELSRLRQFGLPILTGSSRKGFLRDSLARCHGEIAPKANSTSSIQASTAAVVVSILAGAHLVRVHDVRASVEAACIADAVLSAAQSCDRSNIADEVSMHAVRTAAPVLSREGHARG